MKKFVYFAIITVIFSMVSFSETAFKEGKDLFEKNSVEDAVYLFEEALITKPTKDVYKYLAESYNILGMHEDETLVLEEAISEAVGDLSYFNFKLGNAYHLIGNYKNALDSYLEVLTINKEYVTESFLNIGNVSVELELYPNAIDNYTKYLELEPESSQKRKIIKMIFILKKLHKEQLEILEEENKAEEALRSAKDEEALKLDEDRLSKSAYSEKLEAEREARARELEENRMLYASEEQSLLNDKREFEIAEQKVVNPPDADIEEQRIELRLREKELIEREKKLTDAESALRDAEEALEQSRYESQVQEPKVKTEEEIIAEQEAKELQEIAKKKTAEEKRQQALMNDILQSLESISENAKGISAESENAFGELEGSDIDE